MLPRDTGFAREPSFDSKGWKDGKYADTKEGVDKYIGSSNHLPRDMFSVSPDYSACEKLAENRVLLKTLIRGFTTPDFS